MEYNPTKSKKCWVYLSFYPIYNYF